VNDILIGHTGFVGGNLKSQCAFDEFFNSKNFRDMTGREFGRVVCAGVSAVKWIANKTPQEDRRKIAELEEVLGTIKARQFVLVSTIDVCPNLVGTDESYDCRVGENHHYGKHRLKFENFITSNFGGASVLRLSGLFGPGLKKNVIYDLINDNCLDMINPESRFQWYDLRNLWPDICTVLENNVKLVNLVNEPVRTGDIIKLFFSGKEVGSNPAPEGFYDSRTLHGAIFGSSGHYIHSAGKVLGQIGDYVQSTGKDAAK